jgi:hypothetical protein
LTIEKTRKHDISNIPYNLIFTTKFNDSSILITIILCDYLNLSLKDEHVGDVTIPTQAFEHNQNFLQGKKNYEKKPYKGHAENFI